MYRRTKTALIGLGLVAATLGAAPASAAGGGEQASGNGHCARQFEEAQRIDMESYRDFDLETWLASHDDDAIAIYSSGLVVQGREAIGESQRNHFTNREAVWTWTELTRAVDGCRTATIVYDATYAIPAREFVLRLIVSVTYTYKHGKWLSVIDQGTEIPVDS
jgi:hypothetical protein